VTYYLTLLQTASAFAQMPNQTPLTLQIEREASGVPDGSLDATVAASRMVSKDLVRIPGASSIIAGILAALRQMLKPIASAAAARADVRERAELYQRRLDQLVKQAPSCTDEQLPLAAVAALSRHSENGHDSAQHLATDLRWELNRLQAGLSLESVDGAKAYGLSEADRTLVRAFMKGVNETAALKLDHAGLDTTATREGARLVIQVDMNGSDARLVVHITSLAATIVYTDRHRPRTRFFQQLLQPFELSWEAVPVPGNPDHEMAVGGYAAETEARLEQFLSRLGSRLVFLIDWNRARKRLSRLVKGSDAVALLKWAADNNIGHHAFLMAGDTRLINTALERAMPGDVRYAGSLDDLLGRNAANLFLMSVFRIASAAAIRGSSHRLIDDEVEAALQLYLQRSDRSMLGAAAEHATVIAGAIDWISGAVSRLTDRDAHRDGAADMAVIRTWRQQASDITRRTARTLDRTEGLTQFRRLIANGEEAVKMLEQAASTLTLVPAQINGAIVSPLASLCGLISGGVREYLHCLEEARTITRESVRADLDPFLVTVDHVVALEDACDSASHAILDRLVRESGDFRELHLLSGVAVQLDAAFDSLVHSTQIIRDHVLGIAPGL